MSCQARGVKRARHASSVSHQEPATGGVDASSLFRACIRQANSVLKNGETQFAMPAASVYEPYAATQGKVAGLFTNAGDAAHLVHAVSAAASKAGCSDTQEHPLGASASLSIAQFAPLIQSASSGLAPADPIVSGAKCTEIVKMAKLATNAASRVHAIHKPAAAVIHDPCTFMPVAWVSDVSYEGIWRSADV